MPRNLTRTRTRTRTRTLASTLTLTLTLALTLTLTLTQPGRRGGLQVVACRAVAHAGRTGSGRAQDTRAGKK